MINTNLIVHGVPAGHSVWGEDSFEYINRFYTLREIYKDVSFVLLVETQNENNKLNNYYTFILTENVVAKDNRPGSYFGITLRIEEHYCRDVYTLYKLFEIIFNEYALNHIIEKKNNSYRFLIFDFKEIDAKLSKLANAFLEQITNNFKNDFEKNTLSKNKQYNTCVYYNVDDVNSRAFFNDCNLFGKVLISTEYTSKGAFIANIDSQYNKYNAELAELRGLKDTLTAECGIIPGLKNRVTELQNSLQSKDNTIAQYTEENGTQIAKIQFLQGEVSRLKNLTNKDAVVNKTYEMVCDLYEKVPKYFQKDINARNNVSKHSNHSHKNLRIFGFDLKNAAIYLFAFTTCIFVALWYFSPSSSCNHENEINQLKTKNSELTKDVDRLTNQIRKFEQDKANELVRPIYTPNAYSTLNTPVILSVQSVSIRNDNATYTIIADNHTGEYHWKVSNGVTMTKRDKNNNSVCVTINPNNNGYVISLYRAEADFSDRTKRIAYLTYNKDYKTWIQTQ